jgi:hypothetical protein
MSSTGGSYADVFDGRALRCERVLIAITAQCVRVIFGPGSDDATPLLSKARIEPDHL